ncbi:MAG TPA: hypothetical protein VFE47_11505 [Tepidisphaeraceae bacterium]|jgi:hypothetical protein|nr:hypothetical protein [Tepidisphaeraceae bacterium]
MKSFNLDRLEDSYEDPNVLDGYDMDYTIQIGKGKERHIHVANVRQRQLESLIDHVNALLPPKYELDGWSHSSVRSR